MLNVGFVSEINKKYNIKMVFAFCFSLMLKIISVNLFFLVDGYAAVHLIRKTTAIAVVFLIKDDQNYVVNAHSIICWVSKKC